MKIRLNIATILRAHLVVLFLAVFALFSFSIFKNAVNELATEVNALSGLINNCGNEAGCGYCNVAGGSSSCDVPSGFVYQVFTCANVPEGSLSSMQSRECTTQVNGGIDRGVFGPGTTPAISSFVADMNADFGCLVQIDVFRDSGGGVPDYSTGPGGGLQDFIVYYDPDCGGGEPPRQEPPTQNEVPRDPGGPGQDDPQEECVDPAGWYEITQLKDNVTIDHFIRIANLGDRQGSIEQQRCVCIEPQEDKTYSALVFDEETDGTQNDNGTAQESVCRVIDIATLDRPDAFDLVTCRLQEEPGTCYNAQDKGNLRLNPNDDVEDAGAIFVEYGGISACKCYMDYLSTSDGAPLLQTYQDGDSLYLPTPSELSDLDILPRAKMDLLSCLRRLSSFSVGSTYTDSSGTDWYITGGEYDSFEECSAPDSEQGSANNGEEEATNNTQGDETTQEDRGKLEVPIYGETDTADITQITECNDDILSSLRNNSSRRFVEANTDEMEARDETPGEGQNIVPLDQLCEIDIDYDDEADFVYCTDFPVDSPYSDQAAYPEVVPLGVKSVPLRNDQVQDYVCLQSCQNVEREGIGNDPRFPLRVGYSRHRLEDEILRGGYNPMLGEMYGDAPLAVCVDEENGNSYFYCVNDADADEVFVSVDSNDKVRCTRRQSSSIVSPSLSAQALAQEISNSPSNEGTNPTLTESGYYAFFDGQERLTSRDIVVDGEQARLVLFYDDNGNETLDEGEEVVEDYSSIRIEKEADLVEYDLNAGWNLVHMPILAADGNDEGVQTAEELLDRWNRQRAEITHVAKFESGKFKMYSKRESGTEYSPDFPIRPGEGIFVLNRTVNSQVTLVGNRLEDSLPIDLSTGWNLVGIVSSGQSYDSQSLLDAVQEAGIDADTLTQFENGSYSSVIRDEGTLFGNNFNVIDTRGYFIRVEQGGNRFTP
ncbi:MAG: hypothetical protein ACOCXP_01175 [Candidatus Dojkabacteria bacterium]